MKQLLILILTVASATTWMACNKTKSSDNPLVKTYSPAVIIPTDNQTLYCLDAKTGQKKWEYKYREPGVYYTPLIIRDSIALLTDKLKVLTALNMKTGKILWEKVYIGTVENAPVLNNGKVYLALDMTINGGVDSVYEIDLNNGSVIWRNYLSSTTNVSPIVKNDTMWVNTVDGKINCFLTNGPSYNNQLYTANIAIQSDLNMSYSNGFLYLNDIANHIKKINASTGNTVWTYTATDKFKTAPIVYGNMVVAGNDDYQVHCVDINSGTSSERWVYPTQERVQSSACVNTVLENFYMGSNDFNLYAIDHVTGDLRWKFPTGSIVNNSPVSFDNIVYVCSFDKYIYAINEVTGKLVWKYNLNSNCKASPMICTYDGKNKYPTVSSNSEY